MYCYSSHNHGRPRSFHSSLLASIALYIHRKSGLRSLVDMLHSFGFCASYNEVKKLLASNVNHDLPSVKKDGFIQFVFDNADHNINAIDGKDTFHSLGGIKCITPSHALIPSEPLKRLNTVPKAEELANINRIP